MMRIACVEIYFYIQDFLWLACFTKVKIKSIWLCVLINNPDILLLRYKYEREDSTSSNSEKELFIKASPPSTLKLFCPPYPTKHKQALEEKS